jgi:hypothetical protein
MLYALIVHNFLYFPKAPDPIKKKELEIALIYDIA